MEAKLLLYKYRRRFEAEGPVGLVERSRRPLSSPRRVSVQTENAIVLLRRELRPDCGAQTIAYQLQRRGRRSAVDAGAFTTAVREWGLPAHVMNDLIRLVRTVGVTFIDVEVLGSGEAVGTSSSFDQRRASRLAARAIASPVSAGLW